jgi:hypothetical protein
MSYVIRVSDDKQNIVLSKMITHDYNLDNLANRCKLFYHIPMNRIFKYGLTILVIKIPLVTSREKIGDIIIDILKHEE